MFDAVSLMLNFSMRYAVITKDNIKMDLRGQQLRGWLRTGKVVSCCECNNGASGTIKCRVYLE
jgi:hypothetical protein